MLEDNRQKMYDYKREKSFTGEKRKHRFGEKWLDRGTTLEPSSLVRM
jgi:hypothetical protein